MINYKKKYLKYKLKYIKTKLNTQTAGANNSLDLASFNFLTNKNEILSNYDIDKFLKLNDGKIILVDNSGNQDIIYISSFKPPS